MLFYMAALSRTRPILVQVQPCWMELMLKNMPWLLQELLLGRTLEFPLARFLDTHTPYADILEHCCFLKLW